MVPHLVDGVVLILQYADVTILLLDDDLENARNIKFILCLFEHISCLKISFHKSEIYYLGAAKEKAQYYSEIFTCPANLPMKYLGMPIDEKKLVVSQWEPVEDKFGKKIAGWKGNMLSIGDRVTLVNACLSSIALYMLSFLEAPKGFINKADMHRKRMVWQ
jgi:mannosylglycoprotein endo-beta-mannosidase